MTQVFFLRWSLLERIVMRVLIIVEIGYLCFKFLGKMDHGIFLVILSEYI
jgi:hypothetical protein